MSPSETKRPADATCEECRELRQLTREGKAKTYALSVSMVFQAPVGQENEAVDRAMDHLHCATGGWTVSELPDEEQAEYEPEDQL